MDLWTLVPIVVLASCVVAAAFRVFAQTRSHLRALNEGWSNASVRDAFRHITSPKTSSRRADVLIYAGNIDSMESSVLSALTSGFAWRVGGVFTGLALIFTFFLIGKVLADNLGATVGAERIDNAILANAIQLMGGKFYISAVGVICTLVHGAIVGGCRNALSRRLALFIQGEVARGHFCSEIDHRDELEAARDSSLMGLLSSLGESIAESIRTQTSGSLDVMNRIES